MSSDARATYRRKRTSLIPPRDWQSCRRDVCARCPAVEVRVRSRIARKPESDSLVSVNAIKQHVEHVERKLAFVLTSDTRLVEIGVVVVVDSSQ